jgi:hypothetical protein
MDEQAIERARQRLAGAAEGRPGPAELDAALERARAQIEELASAAAELETTLPQRVGDAVRDGVRAEAGPLGRQVAELRGLMNTVVRRLERIEGDALGERHARVDDLALLVDLISSGWRGVETRLARIEQALEAGKGAVVYRIEERRGEQQRPLDAPDQTPASPSA